MMGTVLGGKGTDWLKKNNANEVNKSKKKVGDIRSTFCDSSNFLKPGHTRSQKLALEDVGPSAAVKKRPNYEDENDAT
jgi:hypothetical protein